MGEMISMIADLGFPIAAAISAMSFVFLSIKFILAGVNGSVKNMAKTITNLETRVREMNNQVLRIDILVSDALGLKPDTGRVSRLEKK